MIIDTERVRRHIQAALASLPLLLACSPTTPAAPEITEITQRTAPPTEAMDPVTTRDTLPDAPPRAVPVAVTVDEDPRRRAREVRHAEIRKRPPRPVAGRPLRVDGRDVVACLRRVDFADGDGWLGLDLEPKARAEVAAQWLRDARHEHASIRSFERAHEELEAHGAPASLLEGVRRAAADEAVHTSLCLAMAWRYGGPRLAPGPLVATPARACTRAELAADVFEEGVVNESFAATVAATGARRSEVSDTRALLSRIADDEAAHAALAWATVAWAVATDDAARVAVAERAADLRPSAWTSASADSNGVGALDAHGRLDDVDLERAYAATWRDVIEPLLEQHLGIA